jgi:hypothetical protein
LLKLLPDAVVSARFPVEENRICRALWRAHLARGQTTGDASLVAHASVVLDALEASSTVVAYRMTWRGRSLGVWVNGTRGAVLAIVEPAEIYLAGLE